MKLSMLIVLCSSLFFVTACAQYGNEEYYNESGNYNQTYQSNDYQNPNYQYGNTQYDYGQNGYSTQQPNTQVKAGVKWHPAISPKTGKPSSYVPFPASWKINPGSWEGPNNTLVKEYQGGMQPVMQGRMPTIEDLIRQKIEPAIRQEKARITKMYDLPEVAKRNSLNYAQYWKAMPTNDMFQVKAIEAKNDKGELGLIVLHYTLSQSQYGSYMFYYFNIMETKANYFETAKRDLIYALSNIQIDKQYLAAYNRNEQMKSQQSWTAHNNKMRQNQANFDAYQQVQRTNSDISDIYHQTWKNTSDMNNAGHSKTIDGIYNQNTMTNPHTGQDVQVQYGYNNYYMNNNNQYIGTNDEFYNPQMDQNINHQDWRKVEADDYEYDY